MKHQKKVNSVNVKEETCLAIYISCNTNISQGAKLHEQKLKQPRKEVKICKFTNHRKNSCREWMNCWMHWTEIYWSGRLNWEADSHQSGRKYRIKTLWTLSYSQAEEEHRALELRWENEPDLLSRKLPQMSNTTYQTRNRRTQRHLCIISRRTVKEHHGEEKLKTDIKFSQC